jgi:hypothetical protein
MDYRIENLKEIDEKLRSVMSEQIAPIGHNNPPEDIDPTPFEMSEAEISDLCEEAKNFLDGDPITTQEMADAVSKLIDHLRKAAKLADERRIEENRPFDEGKAAVQARYAPLIADTKAMKGKAVLAIDIAKKALAPWLQRLEAEKQAAAQAARKIADEAERKANEAIKAARATDDLAARESAEEMLREAKAADAAAKKSENDKSHAKGGARAIGLRSVWRAEMIDGRAAARHYWEERRADVEAFFQSLADADVRAGKRTISGFNIIEDRIV